MSGRWTLWARKSWTDAEPDTFYVSVESSTPDTKRFVVVSGNATWLTPEQAKEAAEFMLQCAELCKYGPQREAEPGEAESLGIREFGREQANQAQLLAQNGFRHAP